MAEERYLLMGREAIHHMSEQRHVISWQDKVIHLMAQDYYLLHSTRKLFASWERKATHCISAGK